MNFDSVMFCIVYQLDELLSRSEVSRPEERICDEEMLDSEVLLSQEHFFLTIDGLLSRLCYFQRICSYRV